MFIKRKKYDELLKLSKLGQSISFNYTTWENDFGFLMLIINKKIQISKQFFIIPLSKQVDSEDFIHDKDIEKEYNDIVNEIWNSLSENYKTFLITKYFSNEQSLLYFISETIYFTLTDISITTNKEKINKKYSEQILNSISKLNKKE